MCQHKWYNNARIEEITCYIVHLDIYKMMTSQNKYNTRQPRCNALALVVFYITIIECRLQDIPAIRGSIYELQVDTIFHDRDAFQANISWQSINVGGQAFDVLLTPVIDEYCTSNRPCVKYGLSANTTSVQLPRDPMTEIEHHECSVKLGCTYTALVQTADRKFRQSTNYTVPECIEGVCSCKQTHNIPPLFLNATAVDKILRIHWSVNTTAENVTLNSVYIRVLSQNNPLLRWGGVNRDVSEIEIPFENTSDDVAVKSGRYSVNITNVMGNSTNFQFMIKGFAIDSRGCFGKESNFTYRFTNDNIMVVYGNNNIVKIFLVCFLVVIAVLVVGFACTYRHMQNLLITKSFVKNWRGIYQNVPNVGFKTMKFEENFLYGDDFEHCEIPHSALKMSHNIGRGAFGSVYLAVAKDIGPKSSTGLVAVKKIKKDHSGDEMDEFLCEIAIMKSISRHPNIVALIGYCTVKQPMLMVMEYVGCGDLLNYLRRLREQHEVRTAAAMRMANQNRPSAVTATTATTHVADSSTSSTINLLSQASRANRSNKSYTNLSKGECSNQTSATSFTNPITVTTLQKLDAEVNYLELCHSSNSDASCVTKPESVASTKRVSDIDNIDYTVFPNPQAMSLECLLDHKELHSFAIQIARGMKHIEDRGIIHRDLAARNVLIDENKQLKISDFGLSRSVIYVTKRTKKVPIRWMAIEALRESIYTTKSDVWSFGVVLWEIGTLGGIPYAHVCNELLLKHLIEGHRMNRPEVCSEELYKLMRQCWSESPHDRPFFAEIVQRLETTQNNDHIYVNFDDIAPNYVFPPTAPVPIGRVEPSEQQDSD